MTDSESKRFSFDVPGLRELASVKFGPGVVGRTTAALLGFLVFGIVALAAVVFVAPALLPVLAVFVVVTFMFAGCFTAIIWYGHKHPREAIMEGTQYVEHARIEQGAKRPEIVDVEIVPTANTPPPNLIAGGKDE